MEKTSKDITPIVVGILVSLFCMVSGTLFHSLFGSRFDEVGHGIIGKLLFGNRLVALFDVVVLATVAMFMRRSIIRAVRLFFAETTSPFNLAIFRIVVFFLCYTTYNDAHLRWFAHIPKDLVVAPAGLGFIIRHLPMGDTAIAIISSVFTVACFCAMLGLFTRYSALLTVITGFYTLGLPQFYGKVNHYHHILWFAILLAFSPCADVLALDAIRSAWRRADQGDTSALPASRLYAVPLRFVWLLISLIYFFPGLWKTASAGFAWAFSDNLRNLMYSAWFVKDGWHPPFRIDRVPLLCELAGLGTIIFEISFVFLVLRARTRLLACFMGLGFHNGTNLFMRISFANLQWCYVAFLDCATLLSRTACRLFPKTMWVLYDGNCKICRRTIATLRTVDILDRILWINALDEDALRTNGLSYLDPTALVTDMHAVLDNGAEKSVYKGYDAYRALAARIPLLWPVWPLLFVPFVRSMGNRIYRRIADSRTCSIRTAPTKTETPTEPLNLPALRATFAVGSFLLAANIGPGILGMSNAWPFACYPVFMGLAHKEVSTLMLSITMSDGSQREVIPIDDPRFARLASGERLIGLCNLPIKGKARPDERRLCAAFWKVWLQAHPEFTASREVRFYELIQTTVPEKYEMNPIGRELLAVVPIPAVHPN